MLGAGSGRLDDGHEPVTIDVGSCLHKWSDVSLLLAEPEQEPGPELEPELDDNPEYKPCQNQSLSQSRFGSKLKL